MMRWPHLHRSLILLQVLVATQLLLQGDVSGATIPDEDTYQRAGRGNPAALRDLQMEFFREAYNLGISTAAISLEQPGALESLDRMILWPVTSNGKAWPVMDYGKTTLGWDRWPRIEYDSRSDGMDSAAAYFSEEDRIQRWAESRSPFPRAGNQSSQLRMTEKVAQARLPALLLQPVLAYFRMHDDLPATPGEAYRELGIALIDEAELELLERFTPIFSAGKGRFRLLLAPHDYTQDTLAAAAFFDPLKGAFVLETRRYRPGNIDTPYFMFQRQRGRPRGCVPGGSYVITRSEPLTHWATWQDADIPVIASPITDFLRDGRMISDEDEIALVKKALRDEALRDSLNVGPKFGQTDAAEKTK